MLTRMKTKSNAEGRGFTLIELLVVMIIIGILASIAIPIFLNQQKSARDTQTISDARGISTAITASQIQCNSMPKIVIADKDFNIRKDLPGSYSNVSSPDPESEALYVVAYEGIWRGEDTSCTSFTEISLSKGTRLMVSYDNVSGATAVYAWNEGGKSYHGGDYVHGNDIRDGFDNGEIYSIRSEPKQEVVTP